MGKYFSLRKYLRIKKAPGEITRCYIYFTSLYFVQVKALSGFRLLV